MYPVNLIFEDGTSVSIGANEGETLYQAALRSGIRLVSDCLEGACSACKAKCTAGDYALREHTDEALSKSEANQGYVLACQMLVRSPVVVELPYESRQCALPLARKQRQARICGVERVSASVVRLDVECEDGPMFDFLPGQYAHLSVPGTQEWRSYSFAGLPGDRTTKFYVKNVSGGLMSRYATEVARIGDRIDVVGPFGHFYLRPPERPLLMVAGGTGLAPMLSMLEWLAETKSTQKALLLYGANEAGDFFGLTQLASFVRRGVALRYELMPLYATCGWDGATGHVTSLLKRDVFEGESCDIYLCGPPPMIEAAQARIVSEGMSANAVHAERFVESSAKREQPGGAQ